jgi:hypothetical protein
LAFSLHNPRTTAVEVAEVRTSCDCFRVDLPTDIIEPGQKVQATARIDLSDDPKFAGRLVLDATARAKDQKAIAFVIYADVKVEGTAADGT